MASAEFAPSHALVAAPGATPARWMLVLHGIFGSGANWRTFARRLAEARPAWGFVLVDLRAHGTSQGAPPPHTLDAIAGDLLRLGEGLALDVRGVLGHSFGGKAALAYLARRPGAVERAFILDANPGDKPDGDAASPTRRVLDLLASMPQPLPSREAFVDAVLADGHGRAIADWLAMNVRRGSSTFGAPGRLTAPSAPNPDGFRIRLDLSAIRELIADYFARDLWPVLEDPRSAEQIHLVLGGRSFVLTPDLKARLETLAPRAPWLHVHVLEGAGHWLHVDDPDGLFAILERALA